MGHRDVKTAMVYTHVLNRGPAQPFAVRLTVFEKGAHVDPHNIPRYNAEETDMNPPD
ncbi:MAG: hypothetical protein QUS33_01420 [Dehalococcoidia bacterium]|nr:hypothetical protein [Dehalococcoidia bacterium]